MKEKTKITYRQVNGYLIPNIILPPEQANIIVGKWGAGVRGTPLCVAQKHRPRRQPRHDAQKLP